MKKIYPTITVLCIATLFASCSRDHSPEIPAATGEVEVEMNIIASTPARTRAFDEDEARINDLHLLVFDASGNATEDAATFLYSRHTWVSGQNTYRTVLKTGTDLNIYFAANAEALISGSGLEPGDTYEEAREKLILADPDAILKNNIPMWGMALGKTIGESAGFVDLGTVRLLRSVASADLVVTDGAFEFESAGIVLATDLGYLTHKADNVTGTAGDIKIITPQAPDGAIYNFGNSYTWIHTPTGNKVENKFYMFENDATAGTAPEKRYTKLIVAGKYNGGGVTYYPLAFRNGDNEKVQAARNRKFELTITKVNGPGYSSVADAIESEDVNMEYEVVIWDDGYQDSDIIIHGAEYVSFTGGRTALLADQTGSDALSRFSSNALGWNGGALSNFAWSFDDFGTQTTENPIAGRRFEVELIKDATDATGEGYYLKVTALEDYGDNTGGSREATLSIRIGNIRFKVKLRQVENGWTGEENQEVNL